MADPVWLRLNQEVRPRQGERVLVVLLPDPPRRYRREIRTAIYYNPGEWYIHGDMGDCGYYDERAIERWTSQPEMPMEGNL